MSVSFWTMFCVVFVPETRRFCLGTGVFVRLGGGLFLPAVFAGGLYISGVLCCGGRGALRRGLGYGG